MTTENFTSYKEDSKEMYIFSIHPQGRVWTFGPGVTIDQKSLAYIDFGSYDANKCPHYGNKNGLHWKLIDSEEELNMNIVCMECQEGYKMNSTNDCVRKSGTNWIPNWLSSAVKEDNVAKKKSQTSNSRVHFTY